MSEITDKPESLAAKIIAFLARELAVPAEKIGMLTRLREDLRLDGVDAANLIEAYSLIFDVDIEAFRANDYFAPEQGPRPLFSRILWIFGNGKALRTLTVKDLILAAEAGKLV